MVRNMAFYGTLERLYGIYSFAYIGKARCHVEQLLERFGVHLREQARNNLSLDERYAA